MGRRARRWDDIKETDIACIWYHYAQAALDAAFEWRDIETAPNSKEAKAGLVQIDIWAVGSRFAGCWWGKETYGEKEGWLYISGYDSDGRVDSLVPCPTHWLPLPPAPEE